MGLDLTSLRQDYTKASLDTDSVSPSPFDQFQLWFQQALSGGILEPNAMVLGTSDAVGNVSQRTVLLKAFDQKGFVFYTNYKSRKAQQISVNGKVSILFPWYELERQVAIAGTAEKVSTQESMTYFLSRPHGSQLGAWVSHQSKVITSRSILEQKLSEMKAKFKEGNLPFPDFWGGYRIVPTSLEFWQGRSSRLHDRIVYERNEDSWDIKRLAP
ncbi:MAG: pyridoxamine 5'-phosphate oxidase [Marinoscillum sp.]|jgi:pyridoxamine 5'-phosphate oxidase